jgi:imidazolonepropionase-like amidohydrolase
VSTRITSALLAGFLFLPASVPAATHAIRAGRLVDAAGHVTTNAVIIVEDDRITSVGVAAPPAGVDVIDLSRYTVIPGLIDLHTHMTYYWDRSPGTRPLNQPRRPAGVTVVLAAENARRTLETGVTTVRDLGAANETDYAMRDLINMGRMVGPRMFVAGQGLSAARPGAPPPDFATLAEARVAAGSDWVKIYGSRGSYQSVDTTQTLSYDEMKAAVDAAHARHHRAAIHSYGPSGVRDAVRAGADSVEHGIELDDETIADMVRRGTVWVPTIDHNRYYIDARDEFGFAPETIPPLRAYIEKNLESTQLGTIAPGYYAELVAVEGDPLADVHVVIDHVRWVMKGGAVVVDRTAAAAARLSTSPIEPSGQSAAPSTSAAVQAAVEAFLQHLGDREYDRVATELAPKAIVIVTRERSGEWSTSYQTGDQWIAALKSNPNPVAFREPLTNMVVTVDSDHLAYLRADFQVMRDGAAQSHGVDQFTLVREAGGWKMAVVAYTSLPVK